MKTSNNPVLVFYVPVDFKFSIFSNCKRCNKPFKLVQINQIFCSNSCRSNTNNVIKYRTNKKWRESKLKSNCQRSRKWRKDQKKKGNCVRCGKHNSNKELGIDVCVTCYNELKTNEKGRGYR